MQDEGGDKRRLILTSSRDTSLMFKRRLRTNPEDVDKIITFMEQHGDLIKNKDWFEAADKWLVLVDQLNKGKHSEPRSVEKWKKLWVDLRSNTKKKMMRSFESTEPTLDNLKSQLTNTDRRVLRVLGILSDVTLPGMQKELLDAANSSTQCQSYTISGDEFINILLPSREAPTQPDCQTTSEFTAFDESIHKPYVDCKLEMMDPSHDPLTVSSFQPRSPQTDPPAPPRAAKRRNDSARSSSTPERCVSRRRVSRATSGASRHIKRHHYRPVNHLEDAMMRFLRANETARIEERERMMLLQEQELRFKERELRMKEKFVGLMHRMVRLAEVAEGFVFSDYINK